MSQSFSKVVRRGAWALAVSSLLGVSVIAGFATRSHGDEPPAGDPALERARGQVEMLDHLLKVAVVDITNRYDGPPAAKVAKEIFKAASGKEFFNARLLDATGNPQNEA